MGREALSIHYQGIPQVEQTDPQMVRVNPR